VYSLFYDPTFLLLLPVLALSIWAQYRVKHTFSKYSRINSESGMTGRDSAFALLSESGLNFVRIEKIAGEFSDHYDPRTKVLRLSESTADSSSVAAIGVAAHEAGHAIQHSVAYKPFELRQMIVPVAKLGTTLAFPLFILGLIFTAPRLMDAGIIFFSGAVAFQIITLPVEFDASRRALIWLKSSNITNDEEVVFAEDALKWAASTYVVAALAAVTYLLYYIALRD
jgi:Zn-dependent membrane protease YugP